MKNLKKLTILHSNDMHGDFVASLENGQLTGGVSMLSGYLSRVRLEEKNVIYAISGDMFRGSLIDSEYKGISTIEIMNLLSPDVVTLGNHEVDYGVAHLLFLERCAKFPIINANIYLTNNHVRLFQSHKILEIDGMKVLFIGVLTEEVLSQTRQDQLIGSFVDIREAAREIGSICNSYQAVDIDFTVLLTHIGIEADKKLAAILDPRWGVDLIIGGHSHTLLERPVEVSGIPIVQAASGTDQVGRFDIMVDTDNNCIDSYTWQLVPITEDRCPRDLQLEAVVHKYKDVTDLKYGRIVTRFNLSFYKEVRGVMTCFEPLTDVVLQRAAEDGLTVQEIRSALEKHGLDFRYVVHDPSRSTFNTYYADYDRGLYGEIFLQRKMLEGPLPLYQAVARLNDGAAPELVSQQWGSYYLKRVPLPMLPYDFQRRYRDIPPDEVFQVWYGIYKRIDYSNGIWRSEVLDYVFSHAPVPERPAPDPDGLVTIYRGMGELSTPPEHAISWSTHPGNALWFAVHSGRGTHVAVAKIRPEQIIWYADKYYNENEVIVRPGTVTEYRYEDMIPATEEYVPAILAPALLEFIQYGRQAPKLGYQEESIFGFHGLKHILRVLLLSLIYCHNADDPLSDADKRILIYFSLLHDIGRVNDDKDDSHGEKSVALIRSKGLRIKDLQMGKKEYRIAELLIQYHCRDDSVGEKAILSAPGLTQKEKSHTIHLYHICKDMDGLDRIRFNGLDYRQLRTDYGRRLPLVAGALLEESLVKALDMQL